MGIADEREIVVLPPTGTLALVDLMGGDLSVVGAARVSTGKDPEHASKGEELDRKLIRFLMANGHGTPFEHAVFQFYVKTPIFVAREWFRHRVGSFNEQSGRYATYKAEFYVPDHVRGPHPDNKQMSVRLVDEAKTSDVQDYMRRIYDQAFEAYGDMMYDGIAREMARMVLPVSLYTSFWWTVNARSLMNFLMLRANERAQWEIQQYAEAVEGTFAGAMPLTYAAWIDADRRAP
jgi:thymidylate synthase (FAD)